MQSSAFPAPTAPCAIPVATTRFLVCDDWVTHLVSGEPMTTRWTLDRATGQIVDAQACDSATGAWRDLYGRARHDLVESVQRWHDVIDLVELVDLRGMAMRLGCARPLWS